MLYTVKLVSPSNTVYPPDQVCPSCCSHKKRGIGSTQKLNGLITKEN